MAAGLKGGEDLWVHVDEFVGVVNDLVVAHFDNRINPISKRVARDAEDDVGEPLARHFRQLFVAWQIEGHLLVLERLVLHSINGEAFVLRTVDVANIVTLDN